MNAALRLPVVLLLVLALPLTAGCPSDPGAADGGTDAGVDAGPPPPPPARTLTEARLFGDMPIDNRVLDPNLALGIFSWFAISPTSGRSFPVLRQAFARTPTGQPVLTVPASDPAARVAVAGLIRGGKGPLQAGVWIGHPPLAGDLPEVSLTGYVPSAAADQAFELTHDAAAGEVVEYEGIEWRRYAARIPEGLLGWTMMVIEDDGTSDLYVTGPVLVQVEEEPGLLPRPGAKRRDLNAAETHAARRLRDHLRDSLAKPQVDPAERRAHAAETGRRRLEALRRAAAARKAQVPEAE